MRLKTKLVSALFAAAAALLAGALGAASAPSASHAAVVAQTQNGA
jgi:hypothetical protein